MTKEEREVMRMALEALEDISSFQNHTNGNSSDADKAITAIEKCLANDALEKKAENARELGLDYEALLQEKYVTYSGNGSHPKQIPCGEPIAILMKLKDDKHMKVFLLKEQL